MNCLLSLKRRVMNLSKAQIKTILDKTLLVLTVFIIGNVIVSVLAQFYGVGVIHTPSIDKDVLIYERNVDGNLKGSLIYFSLPVQTRYYDKGSSFGKYVRCKEGELLRTQDLKYYCEDYFLGEAKPTDKDGNKVETFIFNGIIPKDKFFVMGIHPRSFDSRYWGFVDRKDIKGVSLWAI